LRNPISGTQFRRDVKLAQKRGKDMTKLREVILLLIYKIEGDDLHLVRTGTHSDLF
jgi:mRNA interferase YafQ